VDVGGDGALGEALRLARADLDIVRVTGDAAQAGEAVARALGGAGGRSPVLRVAGFAPGDVLAIADRATPGGAAELVIRCDGGLLSPDTPASLPAALEERGFSCHLIDAARGRVATWSRAAGGHLAAMLAGREGELLCIPRERSLHVCLFHHLATLTGADRCALEWARWLPRQEGVIVSVVMPAEGPLTDRLRAAGVPVYIAPYGWWMNVDGPDPEETLTRSAEAMVGLADDFANANPDVFLTNTMVIPWGALEARRLGRPHVWFVQEFGGADHGLAFPPPLAGALAWIEPSSNLVLVNSDAVRRQLFPDGPPDKVRRLYIAVEPPGPGHAEAAALFRRPGATKLIHTGSVSAAKGQRDAVLAVRELVSRGHDVELVILGYEEPTYAAMLRALVAEHALDDRVRILGFRDDSSSVVAAADLVLVCSRREAFGRVTAEAMLLAKPVIGTRAGGTPELVREGETGLLYEPGEPRELANRIEELILDPEKRRRFGERARELAIERFDPAVFTRAFAEALFRLKGAPAAGAEPLLRFEAKLRARTVSNARRLGERVAALEAELAFLRSTLGWRLLERLRRVRRWFARANPFRSR
jgi:glycosyltransferase involved in cell wall biosynthesis